MSKACRWCTDRVLFPLSLDECDIAVEEAKLVHPCLVQGGNRVVIVDCVFDNQAVRLALLLLSLLGWSCVVAIKRKREQKTNLTKKLCNQLTFPASCAESMGLRPRLDCLGAMSQGLFFVSRPAAAGVTAHAVVEATLPCQPGVPFRKLSAAGVRREGPSVPMAQSTYQRERRCFLHELR